MILSCPFIQEYRPPYDRMMIKISFIFSCIELLEFIVVVEVNASQAVVIEQIRASLASITFPLQLDNSTEITAANITTGEPVKPVIKIYLRNSYCLIFIFNVVQTFCC